MFALFRKKPFILLVVALTIILVISELKTESSKISTASNPESEEITSEADTDEVTDPQEGAEKDSTNTEVGQEATEETAPVQTQVKVEQDTTPANKEEINKQNAKEKTATANSSQQVPATSQVRENVTSGKDDFSEIEACWKNFRNAVLANNMSEVKKMTQFPLSTRGAMDFDPIIKFNQDKFDKVFQAFLNESDGISDTVLGYIRNNENLSYKNYVDYQNSGDHKKTVLVSNNTAHISMMNFSLINGQWKLSFIYLNNDIYNQIG